MFQYSTRVIPKIISIVPKTKLKVILSPKIITEKIDAKTGFKKNTSEPLLAPVNANPKK